MFWFKKKETPPPKVPVPRAVRIEVFTTSGDVVEFVTGPAPEELAGNVNDRGLWIRREHPDWDSNPAVGMFPHGQFTKVVISHEDGSCAP